MANSKLEFDDSYKFGIEIEYANARSNNIEKDLKKITPNNESYYNTWKNDDEVHTYQKKNIKYGGEIQSPILTNDKKSLEDLRTALKILKKHRASSDGYESLQVRVSTDIFNDDVNKLYNFLKLYLAYEDVIFKFGFNGSEPRKSLIAFSRPCDYTLKSIVRPNLKSISYNSAIILLNKVLLNKQFALSFYDKDNPFRPESMEYRMFNTTFNYNTIINTINLSVCALIKSTSEDLDTELIDYRLDHLSKRRRTKEDYIDIKEEKAIEFSNIIFDSQESKDSFLLQYKKK